MNLAGLRRVAGVVIQLKSQLKAGQSNSVVANLHFDDDVADANAEDAWRLAHPTLLLGRDPVVVGFADHEIREYSVGSSPGGGDIRRPMLAQAALKRPQQRLAHLLANQITRSRALKRLSNLVQLLRFSVAGAY